MRTRRTDRFQPPLISPVNLPALSAKDHTQLAASSHHEAAQWSEVDLSGRELTGASFTESAFDGVTLHDTQLQGSRFIDCTLTHIIAPKLLMRRTTWRGVELTSSRLGAVEAYDSEFSQVVFEGSKLGWLNFRSSTLRDVVFRDCRIDELDLTDAKLSRVSFEACTVDTLTINGTHAQHFDLRGVEFSRLDGLEGLRGSRITEQQAALMAGLFASHLGIQISAS